VDHGEVVQQVREIAQGRVEIEVQDWKEPVESAPQEEIVGISLEAVKQVTGVARQPKGVSYYSDGAVLANRLRIPMVIVGPADAGMTHQPDEHVEVAHLVQALQAYLLIATRYLG
jgi:succinyl-diaminopimelate desuccinylase